jgi:hypothetical protein
MHNPIAAHHDKHSQSHLVASCCRDGRTEDLNSPDMSLIPSQPVMMIELNACYGDHDKQQ